MRLRDVSLLIAGGLLAVGLIVALLARATVQAWLLTGGVVAAASLAFLARRRRG